MISSTRQNKALLIGILGATVLVGAEPSVAEEQRSVTDLGIEEIVVTAQKREEDLQSVPISISALNATDIERRGVQSTQDLLGTIPNLGGAQLPGAKGTVATVLRGVNGGDPGNLSIDPGAPTYIDGVLIAKAVGGALDVAELERVEVLRGPQGTLYGRNSTGGAINFVTKKPSGEFDGKISGTVGSEGLWGYRAYVDTPSLGTAGEGLGAVMASAGVTGRERDPLYRNNVPGLPDLDSIDRDAYRLALRWEAGESVTVDYAFDKSQLDEANTPQVAFGLTPARISPTVVARETAVQGYVNEGNLALQGQGPLAPAAGDPNFGRWLGSSNALLNAFSTEIGDGDRPGSAYADVKSNTTSQSAGHSLIAAWQVDDLSVLGDVEFKSITGWRKVNSRNQGDIDGFNNKIPPGGVGALNDTALDAMRTFYSFYGANPNGAQQATAKLWSLVDQYGGAYFAQDATFQYSQFSQEAQMVGSTDQLQYALGYYYFNDNGTFADYSLAAQPVAPITSRAYKPDTDATALYMQGTYTPPILDERIAVTLGYRHTEEKKAIQYLYLDDGTSTGTGLFSGSLATFTVNMNYTGALQPASTYGDKFDQQFHNDSGTVTVAYQLNDDTSAFVRWAQGYRSGGYNGTVYDNPFKEETIDQWEFGVKSDLVPGTLRLNASIFQYAYDDLQVSQIRIVNGAPTTLLTNAAKADRWGAEAEAQWSPLDNLLVALSYTHMSGNYDEFPPVCGTGTNATTCITNTANLAERGVSPDDSAAITTDWVFAKTDWAAFMAHLEVYWQSQSTGNTLIQTQYGRTNALPYIFEPVWLGSRTLVNARIGIENVELGMGTLRSSLWVRNAFDEDYPSFGIKYLTLGPEVEQFGEERTYGLDVTWEF